MLNLINRYEHGFVCIPVIIACRKKGLFKLLRSHQGMTFQQISECLKANNGALQVALKMMKSLNLLSQNKAGEYCTTKKLNEYSFIPEEILEIYDQFQNSCLLEKNNIRFLKSWIKNSCNQWYVKDRILVDFLDGCLIIPILQELNKKGLLLDLESKPLLSCLTPSIRDEILKLFISKGWVEKVTNDVLKGYVKSSLRSESLTKDNLFSLTDLGKFIFERILVTGVTASYTSMLLKTNELLFGDYQAIFRRSKKGDEGHIDRKLNVISSGFQHQKFFSDIDEIILSIFNQLPYSSQPKYIADMGCGDGSLLRRIYEVISTKSARGKVLGEFPVQMIGVDYNEDALRETASTLKDIPYLTIEGDIAEPQQMISKLKDYGIKDSENILHVRSFLDHERSCIVPEDLEKVQNRTRINYQSVHVDCEGKLIPTPTIIQCLVEHLEKWSSIVTKHGLIILEVHCLESEIVNNFLDSSKSLHFDALQAFSGQHLVKANIFLSSAAEAGLFPKFEFSKRYPKHFPFNRITLNCFEKRPYQVRHSVIEDLSALVDLEAKCWSKKLRSKPDEIRRRISTFPQGQFVLEINNQVIGVIYSQRISNSEVLEEKVFTEIPSLHNISGTVVQLLSINILPGFRDCGLGDQLLEFMLQYCVLINGIEKVVGITRCSNYANYTQMPLVDYVREKTESGLFLDPVLKFHQVHGAFIKKIIPDYRPEDIENKGYGVLVEYDIHNRERFNSGTSAVENIQSKADFTENLSNSIESSIRAVVKQKCAFDPNLSLIEMGIESLELLELRYILKKQLGIEVDSDFFFRYRTFQTIVNYFKEQILTRTREEHNIVNKPDKIIIECINAVLKEEQLFDLDSKQSLIEFGIESLELLELKYLLEKKFKLKLDANFFFKNKDIADIADYFRNLKWTQINKASFDLKLASLIPDPEQRYRPFPLNEIQQAYWLGRNQVFGLGNVSTHIYQEIDCKDLAIGDFNLACQKLIEKHEMLRTIILADGHQQTIEQVPAYKIEVLDLSQQSPEEVYLQTNELRNQMSHEVLPAHQWPLFNIKATKLNANTFRLHISFDLLIADAWSIYILLHQLIQLYQNPESSLPSIELSFRDYIIAGLSIKDTQQYHRCRKYWFDRIDTLPSSPEIPLAKLPSTVTQPLFKRRTYKISQASWQRIKRKAIRANLTPSIILLTAFADILECWSKSSKFTINLTQFKRFPLHPQVKKLVGDFTSVLLLQVDRSQKKSFVNRAQQLQKQLWQDLDNDYISAIEVQREYRSRGRTQQMGVVFTSTLGLNSLAEEELGDEINLEQLGELGYGITQTPQVILDHQVLEIKGELVFNWDAVEELFPDGLLDSMFNAYCCWLRQLATSEESWNDNNYQLLSPKQLSIQPEVNKTATDISQQTLHGLFINQVQARSKMTAIITAKKVITYEELYMQAHQLGQGLRKLGVKPNNLVAVVMQKGWEQVVAVLGILMSGGAYLPIDPDLPKKRQLDLIEQGEVKHILTQSYLKQYLTWPDEIGCWSVDTQEIADLGEESLDTVQTPEDLAYVIYTSGSTGLPKGVMINHQGAVNTILDINQRFEVKSSDRVLALSALNFDLSVYDIFGMLAAGGTIIIPEPDKLRDPAHWLKLITTHRITVWNSVPALMHMLVDYSSEKLEQLIEGLRLVLLSGDWVPLTLPEKIKSIWLNSQIVSLGGATEASIWSISYTVKEIDSKWKSIPYGKPLSNQRFYVLSEQMELKPVWVPGQLYIGGTGIALGYWKNKQKTQTSFITHPVTQERLYRTGDLGRYLPDGNIEFLGREDFQVKINGYRIELGEIEAALQQISLIKDVIVTTVENSKYSKRLVAYVVIEHNNFSKTPEEYGEKKENIDQIFQENSFSEDFRKQLKQKLPEYMIPYDYIFMQELPLTNNGKIDRNKLPKPLKGNQIKTKLVKPQTEIEQNIVAVWQEVLDLEQVGIYDNFFEVGGNSLLIVRVCNRLQESLGIEKISIIDLFSYPTVYSLSHHLIGVNDEKLTKKIEAIKDERHSKRSHANERRKIRRRHRYKN